MKYTKLTLILMSLLMPATYAGAAGMYICTLDRLIFNTNLCMCFQCLATGSSVSWAVHGRETDRIQFSVDKPITVGEKANRPKRVFSYKPRSLILAYVGRKHL